MFYVRDEISRQMLSESTSKCDRILMYDSESHVNHGVTDHDRRDNTTSMTDCDRHEVTTADTASTSKQCTVDDIVMNGQQCKVEGVEIDGETKAGSWSLRPATLQTMTTISI